MHAWTAHDPPELPGLGHTLHLHDTATRQARQAASGANARMYVCGITPYDATHLGHAATYVAFDLANRMWRDAGIDVTYVQNVTDIDDPLFERAADIGTSWRELADAETALFRDDMAWLNVLPPQQFVGAEEAMPLIVDLIERLKAASAVYDVDGDLYFPVHLDGDFGRVSGLDTETMLALFAERGGDPDRPGKKDPLDCLLWRAERPGEPSWDSPFGRGRPGWHIECVAIALDHLGIGFDVQGGGNDLAFPHHEMCAAEAHVATGQRPFAHNYVYAGLLGLDGEKMSKSLGNLVFASALRQNGEDPAAVRLALLSSHYRADRAWTDDALATAKQRLSAWRAVVNAEAGPDPAPVVERVRARLADDLDTPGAISVIDQWVTDVRDGEGDDRTAPSLIRDTAAALLGVVL